MSLPALPTTADARAIAERVNVLIRDYNTNVDFSLPAGLVLPFAGATAPDGFLLCYGQAVSRSTYADLFAAIGTTYGAGDGSTTFNLPDLRGRVAAGKDDMGGGAANRLTGGGSGIAGTTLGAAGGAETQTLEHGADADAQPRRQRSQSLPPVWRRRRRRERRQCARNVGRWHQFWLRGY